MADDVLRSLASISAGNSVTVTGVNSTLFTALLTTLAQSALSLTVPSHYPPDASDRLLLEYDFIVVGAGSAGAVVAARLSEIHDWTVLAIEAGGDPTMDSEVPAAFSTFKHQERHWTYRTEPDQKSCKGLRDGRCEIPVGKVLGGGSSINFLRYQRGHKCDYDNWAELGNKGWSFEDVLPFFKKSEDFGDEDLLEAEPQVAEFHGKGGELKVNAFPLNKYISYALIDAAVELGFRRVVDLNANESCGVGVNHGTIGKGTRYNTAKAFLGPAKDRKNLHVVKNALVTKIVIDPHTKKVLGVQFHKDGEIRPREIRVKREVIVSAGAINTPQILMLSGIGRRGNLEKMGIAPFIADLPVGKNLQDHYIYTGLFFSVDKQVDPDLLDSAYRYLQSRSGELATLDEFAIANLFDTETPLGAEGPDACPDGNFEYFLFAKNSSTIAQYANAVGVPEYLERRLREIDATERSLLIVMPVQMRARSRGRVLLRSGDPRDPPRVYQGYLHDEADLDAMVRIIETAVRLAETDALKGVGAKLEPVVPEACDGFQFNTTDFWRCAVPQLATSYFRVAGTCKMGPVSDPGAVVDSRLRVRGVKGLRVADASVMPVMPTGSPNAPTIMIGEKAAHIIKEDWGQDTQE